MIEKMPLKFVEISSEKGPITVDHALWVKLPTVQTATVQTDENLYQFYLIGPMLV
jgi:hypothetical protein